MCKIIVFVFSHEIPWLRFLGICLCRPCGSGILCRAAPLCGIRRPARSLDRSRRPSGSLLCACLGGLLAGLAVKLRLGDDAGMISIGNIMLLIPGVALTNSLRDMFSGNTISGLMRFIEAVLLALVIACGFALVAGLL